MRCARSASGTACITAICSGIPSKRLRAFRTAGDHDPARAAALDSGYFKRIAAIEFAVTSTTASRCARVEGWTMIAMGVSLTLDAALDLPRLPRLQDRQRSDREGNRAAARLWDVDPARSSASIDAEALAGIRSRRARAMRSPKRRYADLNDVYEEARGSGGRAPAPRLSGHRGLELLAIEETAQRIIRLVETTSSTRRSRRMTGQSKRTIPFYYLAVLDGRPRGGLFVFYVVFTPIWMGIRFISWLAEQRNPTTTA